MKKWLALVLLACCGAAFAAAPGVVYRGEAGQHPVQVALAYLQDKVSNSDGQFEYQRLDIQQRSQGEDFSHAQVSVEIKGLMDDSVASERYRLKMVFVDAAWVITEQQQDHTCRRGAKGYTKQLCR
ncbi:hypothetical protein HA050_18640 [Iodobacter sp. HSC-16F04]|uniref:Uncharacterized protein n=1 Tax=Iodobacter violaceini TaxID=3044271 RepID=A0ABX0L691_9NEIS|nr:hypothetical protein [Iodobacter violacea]NHQ88128.1 hypothetical protein [Iodobacter violacea]